LRDNILKLAISGKGGVGKSTVAAALVLILAQNGKKILALDADPDANLGTALGIPEPILSRIVPISEQVTLIEERTGAKVKQYGQIFKINPEVSDITEKYATMHKGVALLVLGAVRKGGGGCACPENVLIRALVSDIVLHRDDTLIMDMEAGVEHLGRATTRGVDAMLIVVEPGQRSIDCAKRVIRMGNEIGLKNIFIAANKTTSSGDEEFIRKALPDNDILGFIPYSESIRMSDRTGLSVLDGLDKNTLAIFETIIQRIQGTGVRTED
jgi:CO dehydrogenase maturation factor